MRKVKLSTGELSLAAKAGEAGKKAAAGLDVRLVNLPADAEAGMGVFQTLHERASPGRLAEELTASAKANHGTAAREFVRRLAADRSEGEAELRAKLAALRDSFLAANVPTGAAGQVRSVASRFALVAIAGEIATAYGILPWPRGEAMRAAAACFGSWLAQRGGAGPAEEQRAIRQVRQFLEAHGESRFTALLPAPGGGAQAAPDASRTINRAGWRRRVAADAVGDEEQREFLILPEVWSAEVCRGFDARRVADLMAAKGCLVGATERHRAALVTIPGEGKRRVYRVSGAILADSEG